MRFSPAALALPAAALAWAVSASPVAAATPVKVEGVDDDTRDAIRRVLPDREEPQSLFDAERLAEEAAQRARAFLRSEGWYAATVEPVAEETPPRALVRITPGARFAFAAPLVTFEGGIDEVSTAAVRKEIGRVAVGKPARAADVIAAELAAVAALRARGYAHAKALPRRTVVDHATTSMTSQFQFAVGDRLRLGAVTVEPPGALQPAFAARAANWKTGDYFDPEKLQQLRRDLASTGAFSVVGARLAAQPNTDGLTDVIVTLEEAKPRVIEVGVGWSTTEGFGLEAEWTRRNITRRADALVVKTVLGEEQQSLTAELTRPNAFGPGRAGQFSAGVSHDETGPFARNGVFVSSAVNAADRLRYAISYGVTASADFYSQAEGVENAYVLSAFGEVRRDETDTPLDARRGYLLQLRAEPSISTGDATVAFVRAVAQARVYHTFSGADRYTLAARTRLGWVEPVLGDDNDLPLDRRFYAGGGGSVRGYAFNSIYPDTMTKTGVAPGGRGLLEVSGEARARFTQRIGAVAFVDGGAAFRNLDDAGDMRWGVGVGARYDLGFAPLRFDIAMPVDPRPSDSRAAFYVSIGQAF
ncbi:MAG: BamA/TamA family outer membrane protein [Hyphomonadaceae bacterium]|nr:MAG: outer membrane protein [Caulobacteraceae bacterium]MBT9447456.1 BamA/TamA family outer membrane protein [Hyphomonadaceae bacterium]TPW08760.1 MAG: outer membrane protein [Alphaproteobacteria bacterium]